MSITLKGRTITKGHVQARAIVSRAPLSFTYIDPATGAVIDSTHELYGQIIKGKILVLPLLKGSAMQPFSLHQLVRSGAAPKGLVAREADERLVASALYCDIPLIDRLEKDPLQAIATGDVVVVNADKGFVKIKR